MTGGVDQSGAAVASTYTTRNELATQTWTVGGAGTLGTQVTYDEAGRILRLGRTTGGVFSDALPV